MIDFSLDEMLELARQAELQKRVEADGVKAPEAIPDLSVVRTLRVISDDEGFEIPIGAQGTIVIVHNEGEAYCVEFGAPYQGSERIGLATVKPGDVRVIWKPSDPKLVTLPEDLRGKLGEAEEAEGDDGRLPR